MKYIIVIILSLMLAGTASAAGRLAVRPRSAAHQPVCSLNAQVILAPDNSVTLHAHALLDGKPQEIDGLVFRVKAGRLDPEFVLDGDEVTVPTLDTLIRVRIANPTYQVSDEAVDLFWKCFSAKSLGFIVFAD